MKIDGKDIEDERLKTNYGILYMPQSYMQASYLMHETCDDGTLVTLKAKV